MRRVVMETHPQQAEDMPLGEDLVAVVRAIDPILDQMVDGATKGALYGEDLVDIAARIRSILHEAVARRSQRDPLGRPGDGAGGAVGP